MFQQTSTPTNKSNLELSKKTLAARFHEGYAQFLWISSLVSSILVRSMGVRTTLSSRPHLYRSDLYEFVPKYEFLRMEKTEWFQWNGRDRLAISLNTPITDGNELLFSLLLKIMAGMAKPDLFN